MSRRHAAEAALVGIAAVWGLTFVMVQDAVERLPVLAFLGYRFAAAALLVALLFRRELRRLSGEGWRAGLAMGVFLTGGYLSQTFALQHTSASNAGFITGLFVVLTPVLGALFHTAYLYAYGVRGYEYGVIEVNPRHAVFYRRGLYFELIGPERMNLRVNAPSVLLCVSFQKTEVEYNKYFAEPEKRIAGRSLYAHWFPPDEADGVLKRLRELEIPDSPAASRAAAHRPR